jgi:tetratricopeptide (TPR) repeat protein
MQAQLYAARTLRTARTALAVLLCGLAFAAFGQPDPGQPRTPAPTIDAATGNALNAAIAALQAGKQAEARAALARLDVAKLSLYERSKVEQILFNVAYAEEDYVEARQHLQNALDAGGLNAQEISQVRYQAAQLLMSQEEWQEGAAALEDWLATAVNPNGAAYYLLAVAYYQMDDFARALPPAQRAVDLANEPHEGWIGMLLALYLKNEQYTDAVPLLQKLIAIAPAKKSYWLQLSAAYGQLEDYPNALSTLQVAYNAGLITEDPEIRRLADLLLFQDLPYRGAQVLESAIANASVNVDDKLYEKLANCWIAAGELDKALAPLEQGAGLSASGNLFVRLGEVNVQRGDWPAAERALERGIGKGQLADAGNAQLLMGIALFNQARFAEARAWFQQAMQSERHRPLARTYLDIIEQTIATPSSKPLDREG